MRPLSILSVYIARQFIFWFMMLMLMLTGVILLFEFVEMLRRVADKEQVTFAMTIGLTLLKLPETVQNTVHFAILFGAMFTFWRLTRSQELVVARAAGVSAWQFMLPVLVVAAIIGIGKVTLVNPVVAALYGKFEQLENRYIRGRESLLELSGGGLWLRQKDRAGLAVIFAEHAEPDGVSLTDVIIFLYDRQERYVGRLDAPLATLRNGYWDVRDAVVSLGPAPVERIAAYRLETELTPEKIQESFASPETLSFWDLPAFIDALEATGFSSVPQRLHYNALLAQPLLLSAMVLFAAAFALRQTRRGGTLAMAVGGIAAGFFIFVMSDVVMALGLSESIPVGMAAWMPAGVSLLIGTATLLHLEDG
jgi:lipopolysaccharide export system permease protein